MITIKNIENPEFVNCCLVYSDCGAAYIIRQNKKGIADALAMNEKCEEKQMMPSQKRSGEFGLSRFFTQSAFEDEISYSNRVFGEYQE